MNITNAHIYKNGLIRDVLDVYNFDLKDGDLRFILEIICPNGYDHVSI